MAAFPRALAVVCLVWASVSVTVYAETWLMQHMDRRCTRVACFYRFQLLEPKQNGLNLGVYCKVVVSHDELENFIEKKCIDYTTTDQALEMYRIDATRDKDTKAFHITVANLETLLYATFTFSGQQWEAMQIPSTYVYDTPKGDMAWKQDAKGVALSLILGGILQGRSEDAAVEKRTISEDMAPKMAKRQMELWHLNDVYHESWTGDRIEYTRIFNIQEGDAEAPGVECQVNINLIEGLQWPYRECNNDLNNEAVWPYLTNGKYTDDGNTFTIMVDNIDRRMFARFHIDAKEWEAAESTSKILRVSAVALSMEVREQLPPEKWPRARSDASAESRPLEFP